MLERKNDKRSIRSRQAIELALIDLLKTKPLGEITVAELTSHAGYSRTAFYNNYLDVRDCLECIIDEQAEQIFASIKDFGKVSQSEIGEWTTAKGNVHELMFRAPYEVIYKNKEVYTVLFEKLSKEFLYILTDKIHDKLLAQGPFGAHGQDAKDINTDLYIWSFIWDTLGRILYWIEHGLVYSPEYMGRQQYLKRIDGSYVSINYTV